MENSDARGLISAKALFIDVFHFIHVYDSFRNDIISITEISTHRLRFVGYSKFVLSRAAFIILASAGHVIARMKVGCRKGDNRISLREAKYDVSRSFIALFLCAICSFRHLSTRYIAF